MKIGDYVIIKSSELLCRGKYSVAKIIDVSASRLDPQNVRTATVQFIKNGKIMKLTRSIHSFCFLEIDKCLEFEEKSNEVKMLKKRQAIIFDRQYKYTWCYRL